METRLALSRKDTLAGLGWDLTNIYVDRSEMLKAFEELSRIGNGGEQTRKVQIYLLDRRDQAVRRVSRLLLRTPSITFLDLQFSPLSMFKANRLLQGIITFHHLQFFACRGIPHDTLAHFIARHPDLQGLVVGQCSKAGSCALRTLSAGLKPKILSGPSSCIRGFVSEMTERLFVSFKSLEKDDTPLAHLNAYQADISSFLLHLKAVQAPISMFSALFLPEDLEFTARLFGAIPDLAILQLEEISIGTRDTAVSYPWNNTDVWNAGIHQMRHLKKLQIETIFPPVPGMHPGDILPELGLIGLWDRGMEDLTEVYLRYGCEGGSYSSKWVKEQGLQGWTRQKHSEL